ncbi:hypothetical protein [Bradyrhizobium quebecense]|uniref:Uncharacterized protein n=1 Tax=Bradyrhizobium quebecense TaxID=2748629 RepID=A0ACD3V5E0_9BRAD|nr:hypothetical protein [Bradyrhizobium quebecense]UGY01558.1 hypothetical protein J4P68_0031245 [Bradyrhizobium quebecense]
MLPAVAVAATAVEVMAVAVAAFMAAGADSMVAGADFMVAAVAFMEAEAASTVVDSTAADFTPAALVAAAFTPFIPLQEEARGSAAAPLPVIPNSVQPLTLRAPRRT